MQLCKAKPYKIRQGGGHSLVVSLSGETLLAPGEDRWIIRDESTGTILLVNQEEFKRKYAGKLGLDISD